MFIRSPGRSTMNWLTVRISSATPKIMLAVVPFWRSSPLTHKRSPSDWGSSTSSAVTSCGPSGLNVSHDLPLSHVPVRSIWNSRSETSCEMT